MVMRRFSPWLLAIVLSGCSALQGTPEAPPPATDHPQEIQRYQTAGLQKMDVEAALKAKAEAAKADYYVIIMIDDTMVPGQWYSQAILYRR